MHADTFPDDVVELINYLLPGEGLPGRVFANPGRGYLPEVWLLGSSLFSAQLAGILGLPFSFAYHFAPKLVDAALTTYRSNFRPSVLHAEPRVMVAASVLCAPSESEARWLSGSTALSILQLRTGRLGPLPSPQEAAHYSFTAAERSIVQEAMSTHLIGDPDAVTDGLRQLQGRTGADEIMLSTRSHSYETRVRSLSLIARSWGLVALASDSDDRHDGAASGASGPAGQALNAQPARRIDPAGRDWGPAGPGASGVQGQPLKRPHPKPTRGHRGVTDRAMEH